jgi:GntR family transcriptional regulator
VALGAEIDRGSGIPLYLQIRQQVLGLIQARRLAAGDALPSENELQDLFGVSRATIRHTLALLERDGLVERHQGRGTFVALPRLSRSLPELTSFTEHLSEQRIRSSSRLIAFERLPPGAAPKRSVSDDEPRAGEHFSATDVVRFVRLRIANDTPVGVHTTLTPAWLADTIGLTEAALSREPAFSFYGAIERSGRRLMWAEEHLVARGSGPRESTLLGVPRRTPVMSVLRLSRSADEKLVEAVRAVYLGDKYDYVVQLERRDRTGSTRDADRAPSARRAAQPAASA